MQNAPIIIKKVKKVSGGGHHGGAWKVAYADFVTAMMAFFLLMWLINATSPEQKKGIADYFAPAAVSESRSGSGGVLGGKSFDSEGARDSGYSSMTMSERAAAPRAGNEDDNNNKSKKRSNSAENAGGNDSVSEAQSKAAAKREADMFNKAAMSLRQAMRDMPELAELSKHLIIDQTPEGMRIQIVDQEGRSMFQAGSVEPYPRTQLLLREIAKVINRLPNRITISGHTDASQVESTTGYTNWELSSDRANAARRIFQSAGVRSNRIYQVSGKASSEPLFPDDPYMSANRRISVVLLREAPVLPPNHTL